MFYAYLLSNPISAHPCNRVTHFALAWDWGGRKKILQELIVTAEASRLVLQTKIVTAKASGLVLRTKIMVFL